MPVHVRGRILPNYAMIDHDDKIPFWRKVGEKVHEYDCKFIMQLSHSGRQRDVAGVENLMNKGLSSTNKKDTLPRPALRGGDRGRRSRSSCDCSRTARGGRDEAGLDGVELHASHGYLFTQFLSSGINDRDGRIRRARCATATASCRR